MMGNRIDASSVRLMVDGQVIGKMQSLEASIDTNEIRELRRPPIEGSFTLGNASITPFGQAFFGELLPKVDIVMTEHKYAPPKKPRSKKKRHLKKWEKKVNDSILRKVTYKDCEIDSYHTRFGAEAHESLGFRATTKVVEINK